MSEAGASSREANGAAPHIAAAPPAAAPPSAPPWHARLLPYERALLQELAEAGDALVVVAAGLSWERAVAALICEHLGHGGGVDGGGGGGSGGSGAEAAPGASASAPIAAPPTPHRRGALIIVGATPPQRAAVTAEVARLLGPQRPQRPPAAAPPQPPVAAAGVVEVTADVPGAERARHYASGAACFVTTRILVVDLLGGRLRATQVKGGLALVQSVWVMGTGKRRDLEKACQLVFSLQPTTIHLPTATNTLHHHHHHHTHCRRQQRSRAWSSPTRTA